MPATEPHVRPSPSVPLDESTLSFKIYDIIVDVCVDVLELESYEMFRDPGATQALKVLNENIFQAAAKGDGKTVASLIKGFGEIEPRYKNLPSLRFLERALLVQVGDAKKLAPDQEGLALVESNVPDVSPLQKARLLKIAAEPALTERFLSKVILQIETQQKDLSALYLMRGEIRAAANDRKGFLEDRRAAFLMTPDPTPEEVDARSLGAKIGEELKYLPTEFEKARNNWDLLEKKFSALRITPEERENRPAYSPPTLEEIPAIPVNGVAMVDMDSRYLVMDLTWKLVRFAGAKKNLPVEVNAEIEKKSERLREYLEKRNDLRAAHEEFESLAKIIGPVGQLPSYRLITAWYLCAQGITGKACAILQDPSLLEFGDDVFPGAKINLFNHLWNTPLAERFVTKFMESKKDNASLLLFRAKLRARLRNFPGFEKDMNQALSNFRQQKPDATKSGTRNFLRPWQEIMKQFPGCSGYQREYAATR